MVVSVACLLLLSMQSWSRISGPPFHNAASGEPKARPYSITDLPVTYDPPITEPARKLVNFAKIPIMIGVAEASYHAPYDHCTAKYMQQAGAPVEFVRMQDKGLRGNGHMMMIEKNNLDIAAVLDTWIRAKVK